MRDEPLHPKYRKRATEPEKALGRRYQLIATNTKAGQIAWLDARHRSHVPPGELHEAAPKLLRFRSLHLPARLTRGQRKRWLHLRADWPWTPQLLCAWQQVKAVPAPT